MLYTLMSIEICIYNSPAASCTFSFRFRVIHMVSPSGIPFRMISTVSGMLIHVGFRVRNPSFSLVGRNAAYIH
jgi:hypothetical protein